VIKEPKEEDEERYKYKYPFLTSELFHTNPNELINFILGIKEENSSVNNERKDSEEEDSSNHANEGEDDQDSDNQPLESINQVNED
jgi:hypothetical protein